MSIIKPCERTKVLAAKALEIQDACNITAVAGFLQTTCVELSRIGNDSQGVAKHPITRAIINKLNHLAGLEQSISLTFIDCIDLAEGKLVEVRDEEVVNQNEIRHEEDDCIYQ